MATYYSIPQSRRHVPEVTVEDTANHDVQSIRSSGTGVEQMSSSILIFPSPPSSPALVNHSPDPGTPESISNISVPTSFSMSRFEGSSTRSSPGERLADMATWEDLEAHLESPDGDEMYDWPTNSLHSDTDLALVAEHYMHSLLFSAPSSSQLRLPSRSGPLLTRQIPSTTSLRLRLASRSRSRSQSPRPHSPHTQPPPFHLPFLSFLQQLFSIDPSTILLLTRAPGPSSALFPGCSASDGPENTDIKERPDPIQELLRPTSETTIIKKGFDAMCYAGSVPFSGAYNMFELVVESGGKAWKEVFPGQPPSNHTVFQQGVAT